MRALILGLAAASVLASCETIPNAAPTADVTGEILYLERIAAPTGGMLFVTLEDVSRAGAPVRIMAQQRTPIAGGPPYPFRLIYEPGLIDPRGRYVVRAQIRDAAGGLQFATTEDHPVITQGAPRVLDIVVRPPSAAAPATAETPGDEAEDTRSVWRDLRARGIDFRAVGNEPGWLLDLYTDRFELSYDYGNEQVAGALPAASSPVDGQTWYDVRGPRPLSITIERTPCQDAMSGEMFPTRVIVSVGGRTLTGCGRSP